MRKLFIILSPFIVLATIVLFQSIFLTTCSKESIKENQSVSTSSNFNDPTFIYFALDTSSKDIQQAQAVIDEISYIYNLAQYSYFADGTYKVVSVLDAGEGYNVHAELEKYVKSGEGGIQTSTHWPYPQVYFGWSLDRPDLKRGDTLFMAWKLKR